MNDDTRSDLLEAALLMPPLMVKGTALRPLSLGSYLVLKRTGNRLVTGEGGPDHDQTEDIVAYLYAHSAPLAEVLESARGEGWRERVAEWAFNLAPSDLKAAIPRVIEAIQAAAASVAEPELPADADSGKAPGRPGAQPPSGQ
jgi:hypothetical protein